MRPNASIGDAVFADVEALGVVPVVEVEDAATLSALAGPFASAGVRFMPTGGVTASNAVDYLRLPHVFAVGGTWIAPRSDIAQGRWTEIAERARSVKALSRGVEAR